MISATKAPTPKGMHRKHSSTVESIMEEKATPKNHTTSKIPKDDKKDKSETNNVSRTIRNKRSPKK